MVQCGAEGCGLPLKGVSLSSLFNAEWESILDNTEGATWKCESQNQKGTMLPRVND